MSDDHAHGAHAPAKAGTKEGADRSFMVDRFLVRAVDFVTAEIAKLVAFLLILITLGALFGYFIAIKGAPSIFLFVPAALGIIAYYERDIAIILFVALLLFVFL